MFKIDNDIPVPKVVPSARNKYPLELLQPGQSFFVPIDPEKPKSAKNLRSSMAVRAKALEIEIVTIADETGVRVWRTK
jgi:alanine-alpha-ketoisovalerate/valine-pyruvate aminotransferase